MDEGAQVMQTTLRQLTRDEWVSTAQRFRDYSHRQSWMYSQALADRRGAEAHAVEIAVGDDCIGLANVRVKRVPGIGGGVAYVSGGPLTEQDGFNPDRFDACVDALQAEYVGRLGCTLRIVLPVRDTPTWEQMQSMLEARGYETSSEAPAYETFVLDLSPDVDALRAGLNGKWRNHLKKGEAAGLNVVEGDDPELLREFIGLYGDVRDRKGFETDVDAEFLYAIQGEAEPEERNYTTLAWIGDELAAGAVWGMLGDTCVSILAASGPRGRDTRAAYLLEWLTILEARERGKRLFDLGGIDEEANPGVFKFKRGVGGDRATAPGPYELTSKSIRGQIGRLAEKVYKRAKSSSG